MSVLELRSALQSQVAGAKAMLSNDYQLQLDMLEPWLCRVAIVPTDANFVANSWMAGPPDVPMPWQGRDRLDTSGFSCPSTRLSDSSTLPEGVAGQLSSKNLQVNVQAAPLAITIYRTSSDSTQAILIDRPMAAYRALPQRGLVQHAQTRESNDLHLGLGDKAGELDRTGKRFRCLQTDALGYNAQTSDPLYKHVPWIIVGNNEKGYCGVFYDTFSETNIDLGAEHSNYHDHYRSVESYDRALIYYVVEGPSLADVSRRFQLLVGKPHLQPRWAMGFAHTSMHLADDDNAQRVMLDFADQCQRRNMPISAIHSGSGYTTRDDGRRYVFTWNTKKFPDRDAFFASLENAGLHTCANIKSVLLCEHPLFDEVASFGGFIKDAKGAPAIEMFWGGPGASLDFTHPETVKWWQRGVTEQVLGAGFSATWNDNNECEIWDEQAVVHGFGQSLRAMDVRPIQALLMVRASFEATIAHEPDKRPYTITRAGPVGIARYAQTWSGDNRTSWHTLQWNLANGLSMSLSGLPFVGHDIGGFDGPKPSAELLCRWVEMMCLHPRAVMNSWKPDEINPATLPWMHAQVESKIRDVLTLRYHFLPWLYHLSWCSHTQGTPSIAPMMLYYSDDACVNDHSQFMVGEQVLVAPVTVAGDNQRRVYLPDAPAGWYAYTADHDSAVHYDAGQSIVVDAPIGQLPLFVRGGSVIPIATGWDAAKPHDASSVCLTVYVTKESGEISEKLFFDDGESWAYQNDDASLLQVDAQWNDTQVQVIVTECWSGKARPDLTVSVVGLASRSLDISLP